MRFLVSPIIVDAQISSQKRVSCNNKMGANWWERIVVRRSAHAIDALVEKLTERSRFLKEACPPMTSASLAVITRDEVQEGALLGHGTYSEVHEVADLELVDSDDDDDDDEADPMSGRGCEEINVGLVARAARQTLQTKVRDGSQYAIKHLKPELLKDPKAFESAAADLIMEARFMTMLSHPNILNMSGVAMGGTAAYACTGLYDAFFIIVERLDITLDERLREWRRHSATHFCDAKNASLELKMNLALQLGSALAYLHDRRLVFRDLKPHNCGLTKEGRLKLFDFGFCRELPQNDSSRACSGSNSMDSKTYIEPWNEPADHEDDDRLYGMSGKGTLMYMSPEVLGTRRYNQKADVYSWSLIFYEMLTLRRPYNVESVEAHRQTIFCRGERPQLHNSSIPMALQDLLETCWDGNVAQRFSMLEAVVRLEDIRHDSNQPGPLSRDDSFDICLATASSIIWESLATLWNSVLEQFQTEHNDHEGRESNVLDSCMVPECKLQIETVVDKCKPFNSPDPPDFNIKPATSSRINDDNDNDNNSKCAEGTTEHHINGGVSVHSKNRIQVQQALRSHHGCVDVERPHGKRVDRLYKDRLLRTIHSAHRTHRIAPPNHVVPPSA